VIPFITFLTGLLDEVNSGMAKTMAKRNSFNNMNTEIENAICIQTSSKETNDLNRQTESTNDKEVNLVYRCPICREEAQENTIA
jgi:hypothetical protein